MALSETTVFEPSAAELINLKNILQICTDRCTVPDVGEFTIRPDLSLEHHYTFALDRFERTARVFDESYYEEEVLSVVMSEAKLDELVVNEAKANGVPELHFPKKRQRSRAMRPAASMLHPVRAVQSAAAHSRTPSSAFTVAQRPYDTREVALMSPGAVSVVSSDDSTLLNEPTVVPTFAGIRLPKGNSVISFMSASSSQSSYPHVREHKHRRRDSLMQLFRRSSSRYRNTPSAMGQVPMCATPSIAEVPELTSAQSHGSQDLSSLQSLDISVRTSTSSFGERHPLPTFEPQQLRMLSQTPQFQKLKQQCENELLCFNDFAQHQLVSLPLILARNRLWLADRKELKLDALRKQVRSRLFSFFSNNPCHRIMSFCWGPGLIRASVLPKRMHAREEEIPQMNLDCSSWSVTLRDTLRVHEPHSVMDGPGTINVTNIYIENFFC
jgi:hypothetical protein